MSVDRKILQWLETEIFEGNIALGEDLPDDRRLAATIKSSHNSTREALKSLETMGVLRLYEGKRKTIIPRLVASPAAAAAPALRLHMAQARYPVRDMIQTRIMIESWALEHADRESPAMFELQDLADRMSVPGLLPTDFHQLEVQFHIALTKLANNHLVTGLMTSLSESMGEYLFSLMGKIPLWSSTATRLRAEHQAIIDAVASGDNDLAKQLVISSIEQQYIEAGIDLDEATGVANEMPGTVATLEPVDIDTEDLVPQQWQEAVSPDIIAALENISGRTQPPEIGRAQGEDTRLEDTATRVSEPAGKPDSEATGQGSADHDQRVGHVPVLQEGNILRAPETARKRSARRRGTVSSPVHATVIKPIDRSEGSSTALIAGQLSARSRPVEPDVKSAPEQTEAPVSADPSGSHHGANNTPDDGKESKRETEYLGGKLGKWLGFTKPSETAGNRAEEDTELDPGEIDRLEKARAQRLEALTGLPSDEQNAQGDIKNKQ